MKVGLLITLAGLAISFVVPTLAQQKDTADPQIAQQIETFSMKYDEAFNKNDAAAVAAFFTVDAVQVAPEGLFSGRGAIEKRYADVFQRSHPANHSRKVDQLNVVGNAAWAVGEWSTTNQGQNGTFQVKGYWSALFVRDGDDWKFRMSTFNITPPPTPPAETK